MVYPVEGPVGANGPEMVGKGEGKVPKALTRWMKVLMVSGVFQSLKTTARQNVSMGRIHSAGYI
jgi:hypothetical protein